MSGLQHAADARRDKTREKRAKRTPQRDVTAGWRGFINWSPSEADKAEFDAWAVSSGLTWFGEVERAIENGFKLTLKWDPRSEAYLALFTSSDEGDPRYGIALTMRGGTPETALMRLVWAHFYVIGERYEEYFVATARKADFW